MNTIAVLIVVDVVGALSSGPTGGLQNNVYLVDTNKYVGSGAEGQAELKTACQDGQTILWSVAPVAADTNIQIESFTGQMVTDGVCVPKALGNDSWEGLVEARGTTGQQQYSVVLSADGQKMSFDPFLIIS